MSKYPAVAVVGSGYWGRNLVRNFHALGSLRTVCDTNDKVVAALQSQYADINVTSSFAEVLVDPTVKALAVATPAGIHASMVEDALLAGKDVLVEKPLALSESKGQELVRVAEERQCVLMVGHLLWYHPAVLRLKELIEAGELGRLQYIYSQRLNLGRIRREENILWSFAPHDISVILGLVGEMPDRVQAQGGYYLHKQIADVTVTSMAFPSGVCGHVFVSWLHPYKEQRLVVIGDRKMAVFNDLEEKDKLLLYPHTIEWKDNFPVPNRKQAELVQIDLIEPLRAECEHFLECVTTRARPRTDGQEALRVVKVLGQCQDALENQDVKIPQKLSLVTTKPASSEKVFIHPTATVDEGAHVGVGTNVWHYSHVMSGAKIGRKCNLGQNVFVGGNVVIGNNVKIQNNVSVYEGVELEDDVFCGPSMVFTNVINPRSTIERKSEFKLTLVKRGATLGANCTILCGHTIGRYAFIGAGTVVTRDVPDYALIVGTPGRIVGWMCRCGEKLAFTNASTDGSENACVQCGSCASRYLKRGEVLQEEVAA